MKQIFCIVMSTFVPFVLVIPWLHDFPGEFNFIILLIFCSIPALMNMIMYFGGRADESKEIKQKYTLIDKTY